MLYSSLNQYLLFSDQMLKQKTVKGLQQIDSVKKVWYCYISSNLLWTEKYSLL